MNLFQSSLLSNHWQFVTKPFPPARSLSLIEGFYPNVWTHFFTLTLFFILLNRLLSNFLLKTLWPTWWSSLPERKREEYPAYVVSLFHHLVAVPFAWILMIGDYQNQVNFADPQGIYALSERVILPWCSAYLAADALMFCLPQVLKYNSWEYILHHIAILWMVYELLAQRSVNFTPYFGHLVISETTSVFFCTAWLVRVTWPSTRGSFGVNVLEHLFALTFFLLRGIHLTLMLVRLFVSSEAKAELGLSVRMTFLAIAVMQWLWLFKIGKGLWQGRRRERSQMATQQAEAKKKEQ